MAAVEKISVPDTAPRSDQTHAASKIPFAPFLASHLEARLSDLAAPRPSAPANTDRYENSDCYEKSRNDRAERPAEPSRARFDDRDDTRTRASRSSSDDQEPRTKVHTEPRTEKQASEQSKDIEHTDSSPAQAKPAKADPETKQEAISESNSPETDVVAARTSEATEKSEPQKARPETASSETTTAGKLGASPDPLAVAQAVVSTLPDAAIAAAAATRQNDGGIALEGESPTDIAAAPVLRSSGPAPTPVPTSSAAPGNTQPSAPPPGLQPIGEPALETKAAGKMQIAGMVPSNDDTPFKVGSDVPQVVRDVQSIVARPTNASGTNLVHAHQQGESLLGQIPSNSTPAHGTAPASSNASQTASLHVGADPSQHAGQNAGQGTGQSAGQGAGNSGGQNANGQAGGNSTPGIPGQIAGAPGDPTALQQNARDFQSSLARAAGPNGAAAPLSGAGDSAAISRGDAPLTGTGAIKGSLSADPASRAAQASAPEHPQRAAASEQVSVTLKKAIENGDSKIRIQLRPHELGRVEVKLDIAGDGRTKALILAERPETLDFLQRDSRVLERALQDAGLKTDHNSLSFDLQGRDGDEQARQAQNDKDGNTGKSGDAGAAGDADGEITETPIPATAIGLAPDGSVNFLA